jgi:dTDP-4-amino-4,6-dideoxygalactose transaminase
MAPTHAARILHHLLAIDPIVQARRTNYTALANGLLGAAGARLLSPQLPTAAAPYVCPLWVDDPARADLVYAQLRQAGLPVFRWDQIWPGTPVAEHDTGPRWSRQVIQLLCHQSLGAADTARMVQTTRHLLQST